MHITGGTCRHSGGRRPDRAKDVAILEAARALFLARGYHGTAIESIAARAGVSKVTIYKRLCAMLAARGLGVEISSHSTVLADRSLGWVHVTLFRKATHVQGAEGRTSTVISRVANTPEAEDVMLEALSNVLTEIARTPDVYVDAVSAQETKIRRALAVNP